MKYKKIRKKDSKIQISFDKEITYKVDIDKFIRILYLNNENK